MHNAHAAAPCKHGLSLIAAAKGAQWKRFDARLRRDPHGGSHETLRIAREAQVEEYARQHPFLCASRIPKRLCGDLLKAWRLGVSCMPCGDELQRGVGGKAVRAGPARSSPANHREMEVSWPGIRKRIPTWL